MAEFWIRRTAPSEFLITDLGITVPAGPTDYDLRNEAGVPFDEINASADLAAAFLAGDLDRITGNGGSVIPAVAALDDSVQPHGDSHTAGGSDELDVTGLSGLLATAQTPAAHTHVATEVTDFDAEVTNNTSVTANTNHRNTTGNPHSADTDDIGEGSTNLYYTETRVNNNVNVSANTAHRNITSGNPHGTTATDVGAIPTSEKGAANGVATLDGNGRVPASQLTVSAFEFKGSWNASTNTPPLSSGSGTQGDTYRVTVAGSTNLDGITDWQVNDLAIFDGTVWTKTDNSDAVVSVNTQTGAVVLDTDDISEGSTNEYYTNAKVEAVALKRSANDFTTYTQKSPPVNADVVLIEDSEDGFSKKKVPLSDLLGMTSGTEWFSGYDSVGGASSTGAWVDVPLDSEHIKDAAFTHTGSSAEVTVDETFTYQIAADVSLGGATNRTSGEMRILRNGTEIPGTRAFTYNRNAANNEDTASVALAIPLTASDVIKVQFRELAGTGPVTLLANGSRLTIAKIKGEKGDTGPAGGAGSVNAEDEGSSVSGGPFDTINFVGSGVAATDGGSGTLDVSVSTLPPAPSQGSTEAQNASTSTTYQQKHRQSVAGAVAGTYKVEWYMEVRNFDPDDAVECRIQQDDTTDLAECRYYSGNPGGVNWLADFSNFSGFIYVSLSGSHDFDLDFRSVSGGSCECRRARISITRVT